VHCKLVIRPAKINFAMSRSFDTGWKEVFHSHVSEANDAHCCDSQRFIVRADEKLTPVAELKSAIRAGGELA